MTFIIWLVIPLQNIQMIGSTWHHCDGTWLSGTGSACNITNGITLHPYGIYMNISCIYHGIYMNISCIYHVYTSIYMYTLSIYRTYTCIYNWYRMYILFSGFRGTRRPPAPPMHGLEDNLPDVHDEADFDIPESTPIHKIRAELETERARLLNQDGTARDRCKDRVRFWWHI